ncbi:MAG: lipocalin family protein, partial [Candidatus Marinamargulisbacteria bacterium]|nr:lipocalin family protein [Candidatus Marinamargulisbacteria bacterium]
ITDVSIRIVLVAIGMTVSALVTALPIPVLELDLNRYQGTWYEVARMPNRFQKACVQAAVARYQRLDSGRLSVENQCETANGKRKTARGIARQPDPNQPGKLEVSFFRILGIRPIWGAYWVLAIDADYSVAVVGDAKQQYAWVLARTPTISKSSMQAAIAVLTRNGYSIEGMIKTGSKPAS